MGSNVAGPGRSLAGTLAAALESLDCDSFRVTRISRFFRTPCWPPGAGPDFVNAAAEFETALPPEAVLERLHAVEAAFGRERGARWAARTLDLDLIAMGDLVLPDAATQTRWRDLPADDQARSAPGDLILPHPRMQDRAFVLVPLAEIAPDWRHPILGLTVAEMLAALSEAEKAEIYPVSGPWEGLSALVKAFATQ
ncbi:MAG: 2-amino-4-hydroxy-6-hydroxymethyldihydropteridine diphosphokinase [Rhodovulum sp.]